MNKTILAIIIFLYGGTLSFSQNSNWVWAKGADASAEGSDLAADIFGNIYLSANFIASSVTFGSYTLTNSGTAWNACIVKYDSSGNVLWANKAGGTSEVLDISTDHLGNVYMTGNFSSPSITFGSITLIRKGTNDAFVVKYNSSGNVMWAKNAGGVSGSSGGYSVAIDDSDNVYLSGIFGSSSFSFGSFTLSNIYGWNLFLGKYDALGNEIWAQNVIGSRFLNHITTDSSGNIYLTGSFNSPTANLGSTTLVNFGMEDVFLAKFNSSGNILWAKNAGGNGSDGGACVVTDNAGNVYLSGTFISTSFSIDTFLLPNSGCVDIFLAKYDTTGNVIWVKGAGGTGEDRTGTGGLSINQNGTVFMSGSFGNIWCGWNNISFDQYTLIQSGWDPMFIAVFDHDGKTICASALASGGNDINFPNAIAADPFGNAYIGADYAGTPFIIGKDSLFSSGEKIFIAKYYCDVPHEEAIVEPDTLIIPNIFTPNSDGLNDVFNPNQTHGISINNISIYNRWGQLIHQEDSPQILWDGNVNNKNASDGIYYWIVEYQNKNKNLIVLKGFVHLIR